MEIKPNFKKEFWISIIMLTIFFFVISLIGKSEITEIISNIFAIIIVFSIGLIIRFHFFEGVIFLDDKIIIIYALFNQKKEDVLFSDIKRIEIEEGGSSYRKWVLKIYTNNNLYHSVDIDGYLDKIDVNQIADKFELMNYSFPLILRDFDKNIVNRYDESFL